MTLPPGAYTAWLSGVGGATGVGLIEVFQLTGAIAPPNILGTYPSICMNVLKLNGSSVREMVPSLNHLRDRAPKDYQAALLVVVFIIGLFLGLIAGRSMVPEATPYYLPSENTETNQINP